MTIPGENSSAAQALKSGFAACRAGNSAKAKFQAMKNQEAPMASMVPAGCKRQPRLDASSASGAVGIEDAEAAARVCRISAGRRSNMIGSGRTRFRLVFICLKQYHWSDLITAVESM